MFIFKIICFDADDKVQMSIDRGFSPQDRAKPDDHMPRRENIFCKLHLLIG